jgi:transposase
VIWRKLSFGSASDRGSRFVERILTVAATCRQQGRNVLDYLVAACEAHARGERAPSLLPQAAEHRLVA